MNRFLDGLEKRRERKTESEQRGAPKSSGFRTTNLGTSVNSCKQYTTQELQTLGARDEAEQDVYEGLRLAQRYLDSLAISELTQSAAVLSLGNFKAGLRPPDFAPRAGDNVVVGVISGTPRVRTSATDKEYLIVPICDMRNEADVYIYGKPSPAFEDIRVGTVVAMMNPKVMPPTQHRNLALSIPNIKASLIEIGQSLDLAQCLVPINKDKRCKNWVDLRYAETCEYHLKARVYSNISARPELNSTVIRLGQEDAVAVKRENFPSGSGTRNSNTGSLRRGKPLKLESKEFQDPVMTQDGHYTLAYTTKIDKKGALPSVARKQALEKKNQRKIAAFNSEMALRQKLAARPGGYMLKQFDAKGVLLNDEDSGLPASGPGIKPSTEMVSLDLSRKLGFNPIKFSPKLSNKQANQTKQARSVRKPARRPLPSSNLGSSQASGTDDSDLEIV